MLFQAGTGTIFSGVADVALEVHIIACAGFDTRHDLMLLTIVALGVLLTANKCLVLAEEALAVTKAAIMRSP